MKEIFELIFKINKVDERFIVFVENRLSLKIRLCLLVLFDLMS